MTDVHNCRSSQQEGPGSCLIYLVLTFWPALFCFIFQVLFTSRRAHVSVISVCIALNHRLGCCQTLPELKFKLSNQTFDDFAFQGFTQCANKRRLLLGEKAHGVEKPRLLQNWLVLRWLFWGVRRLLRSFK